MHAMDRLWAWLGRQVGPHVGEASGLQPSVAALFARAVDQLGDPNPPTRMGALYALELLGQEHPEHRPAIVDLICAYLRMPFDPPPLAATDHPQAHELQVRLAAQRALASHLRPTDPRFWPGTRLDLAGAALVELDMSGCRVDGPARFDGARFHGSAWCRGAVFGADASFTNAVFSDHAWFERTVFHGDASFDRVDFRADAWFGETAIAGRGGFSASRFAGHAWFAGCVVRGPMDLTDSVFRRSAGFRGAVFQGDVRMTETVFVGPARVSRRAVAWNLCPPGWEVMVDPDNESVGQLRWSGSLAASATTSGDLSQP